MLSKERIKMSKEKWKTETSNKGKCQARSEVTGHRQKGLRGQKGIFCLFRFCLQSQDNL